LVDGCIEYKIMATPHAFHSTIALYLSAHLLAKQVLLRRPKTWCNAWRLLICLFATLRNK